MNNENQKSSNSVVKNLLKKFTLRDLKLKTKIQLVFLSTALITILIISFFGIFINRKSNIENGKNQLELFANAKKSHIEEYFNMIQNQAKLMADNEKVITAMNEFKVAFDDIASDNFTTTDANSVDQMKKQLDDYYTMDVIPGLNHKAEKEFTADMLLPSDDKSIILQYLYIADNPKPKGEKQLYNRAKDASQYTSIHEKYHKLFWNYLNQFGYDDILLVDNSTGNVIYSVTKNTDFATNLNSGAYNRSILAEAYRHINSESGKNAFFISDMGFYIPTEMNPVLFLACPVYNGTEKTGIILFEIRSDRLKNILATVAEKTERKQKLYNDLYIVGNDNLLRTDDPALFRDFNRNIRALKKKETTDVVRIEKLKSAVLSMESPFKLTGAFSGLSGFGKGRSFDGKRKIYYYTPLNIKGLNWVLVTDVPRNEIIFTKIEVLILISVSLLILLIVFFLSRRFSGVIINKIEQITSSLRRLSKGESFQLLKYDLDDEIGETVKELNNVISRIDEASRFTLKVGEGDFDAEFELRSEKDQLGLALTKMKNSLQVAREEEEKRKVEDDIRNWTNQGIAKFNDLLRQDNHDMDKLSYNLIKNLIEYLSANIGGLYLLEGENENEKYLQLIAAYAYDRRKYEDKRIEIGEGLIGNCYLEKQTIFLKEIPEDYVRISSGMGHSKPRSLLIVPMKLEDDILGIIEIGSINVFKPHEIEFVERIADNTAATMVTVRLNTKTAQLLDQSKMQAEQSAAQEEELRQNLEEMQATQEEMKRKEEKQKQIVAFKTNRRSEKFKKILNSFGNRV
jgi:putative methionine-R-sulfoxide reductase with GAF domain